MMTGRLGIVPLVKAEIYSDHLNTQNCQGYLFAFYTNEDGSLRLSSVT